MNVQEAARRYGVSRAKLHRLLRLRHLGLPTADQRKAHREGWDHYLARLVVVAAGGDPGPDPWAADAQGGG